MHTLAVLVEYKPKVKAVFVVSTQSTLSAMNNDSGVDSSDVQDKSMRLGL